MVYKSMQSTESSEDEPKCNRHKLQTTTSSSCSSSSTESALMAGNSDQSGPPPLDGGYGWVIVLAAFLTYSITDGVANSFGILYVEFLNFFKASKSLTSLIGSIFYSTALMAGPLASALAEKYGCRKVLMFGGAVAAISCLVGAFSNSIELMCLIFGMAGLGMAMVYVTVIVMVSRYFEKKRALVTGLAICGSGLGTFAFAPLTEFLVEFYGWRGTMIIWSGALLHIVVLGALLRPLKFTPAQRKQRSLQKFERMSKTVSHACFSNIINNSSRNASTINTERFDVDSSFDYCIKHCYSQIQIPTFLKENEVKIDLNCVKDINNSKLRNENIHSKPDEVVTDEEDSRTYVRKKDCSAASESENEKVNIVPIYNSSMKPKGSSHTAGNDSGNITPVPSARGRSAIAKAKKGRISTHLTLNKKHLLLCRSQSRLCHPLLQVETTSCPELFRNICSDDERGSLNEEHNFSFWRNLHFLKHMKHFIKALFDPSILVHRCFIVFALSNVILYFFHDSPYIFMVDRAEELGVDKTRASFLTSLLGISNSFGQLINGFIGNYGVNFSVFYGVSMSLCGLSSALMPLFSTFEPLAVLSGAFGMFMSVNYSLTSVILVEYLGLDKLSNAYGLIMLIQGVASLVGPPIAGALYDSTGTYDATFYIAGVFIAASGLMLLLVPCAQRCSTTRPGQDQNIEVKLAGPQEDVTGNLEQREANCTQHQPQSTLLVQTNGESFV